MSSTAATCSWQDAVMRAATSNEGSSDNAVWEAAMNAELRSSARRTGCAGARRDPCLTERSQQCHFGPEAWKHDLHGQGERHSNVGWHRQGTCGKHCQSCMERVVRAGGTAGGACGLHRQNEVHADVDSVVPKNLADNRVALPGDTRVAPPGGGRPR